jgi:hypothetical protein
MNRSELNAAIDECFSKFPDREYSRGEVHMMLQARDPSVRKSAVNNRITALTARGFVTKRTAKGGAKLFRWAGRKASAWFPAGQVHKIDRGIAPGVLYSLRVAGRRYRVLLEDRGLVQNAEKLVRLGVNADEPHCRVPGELGIEDIVTHIQSDVAQLLVTPDIVFFDSAEELGPLWYHEPYFLAAMEYLAERHNVAVILSAQRADDCGRATDAYEALAIIAAELDRNRQHTLLLTPSMTAR